jgi:hypothetical protein
MKRIFNLVALIAICNIAFSQTPKTYQFRNPSKSGSTYTFLSVAPGINAIVTVTASKNATVDVMDDSSVYRQAWQPNIKYTNATRNANDSSYVEFKIDFIKSSSKAADLQNSVSMTIVDCDGPGNNNTFREFVRASMPATTKLIKNSTITTGSDASWLYFKSGTAQFNNIDTSNYAAMAQVNYTNIYSFRMRVGAIGIVSANSSRQASFYFKAFTAMVVPLPVTLNNFEATIDNNNGEISWSTSSEENLNQFEVTRSIDGKNFTTIGSVNAIGNSNEINAYNFTDANIANLKVATVFYQLRMVDENGDYRFSSIAQVKLNNAICTVSVYPNPTSDYLNVSLTETVEVESAISIMDANGKAVALTTPSNSNESSIQFDIRQLENGIYFINILNNDGSLTSAKFIKR